MNRQPSALSAPPDRIHLMTSTPHPSTADLSEGDLVVLWDTMCDASNDVRGACAWLARHADTEEEAERWWAESREVLKDRRRVNYQDVDAQWAARERYRARARQLDALIDE